MTRKPVLIVGGGIGGMALGIALAQRGLAAEIWERVQEYKPVGAGIALAINGMAVLRALGIADDVESRGAVLGRFAITDHRERVLGRVDLRDTAAELGNSIGIHRAELHHVLSHAAAGVPFRSGLTVSTLESAPDGVTVTSTAGDRGEYSLVVGADGIRSRVRELAFGRTEPTYAGYTCWRLVLPNVDRLTDSVEQWGHGKRVGLVPIGQAQVYIFTTANLPPRESDPAEGRVARFAARFAEFEGSFTRLLPLVVSPEQLLHNDIEEIWLDHWHEGRVVLLGDAAHAMTPNSGQGAGMALEDAWVLAERLAESASIAAALREYEAIRRPRVRALHRASKRLGQIAQLSSPFGCGLRNSLIKLVPAQASLRGLRKIIEEGVAVTRRT